MIKRTGWPQSYRAFGSGMLECVVRAEPVMNPQIVFTKGDKEHTHKLLTAACNYSNSIATDFLLM